MNKGMGMRTGISILFLLGICMSAQGQYPYPYGYGPAYSGAGTTVAGSAMTGAANLTQAAGQRNLSDSMAAINYSQARSMELDNNLKYTNVYFEKRQVNEQYRESQRRRTTPEQLFRINQQRQPKPLTASQLDPVTGALSWPGLLQDEQFTADRNALEALFADRAGHSHMSYQDFTQVQATGQRMQSELKKMINDVPPTDYIRAKSFLESLMSEAQKLSA
jgi:hypothetical protein